MPAPSPLAIAASSVQRLLKEETYYTEELVSQERRVQKLEKDINERSADLDENAEYMLKQEKQAKEETKAVFGPLRKKLADAVAKLEEQIALGDSVGGEPVEELVKAQDVLKEGQHALEEMI